MDNKQLNKIISVYKKVDRSKLVFLSDEAKLEQILLKEPLKPANRDEADFDSNLVLITKNSKKEKHGKDHPFRKESKGTEEKAKHHDEERKKVYTKGYFAKFYEFSEGTLDKEDKVWYYKLNKDIIGPVSCYDMDKMAYYKTITDDTKVAFKSLEKFVKFGKIKSKVQETEEQEIQQQGSPKLVPKEEKKEEQKEEKKEEKKEEPKKEQQKPKAVVNLDDPNQFPAL